MKRIVSLILLLVMIISLCACGNTGEKKEDDLATKGIEDVPPSEEVLQTEEVQIEYYEECSTLPTPDTCINATYTGSSTSSVNGVTTKIQYTYSISGKEQWQDYADYLESNGFTIEKEDDTKFSIIEDEYIIATASCENSLMTVEIMPEGKTKPTGSKVQSIAIGDTITATEFTFTLNNVELTYEVKPYNTSGFYTSFESANGKIYIHIDGEYTNTSKRDISIRDLFTPTADYDNGYIYTGQAVVNDGDSSFTWASSYLVATPLESCHYHGLIEVPEVVESSTAPLFVTFTIDGTMYRYDIR